MRLIEKKLSGYKKLSHRLISFNYKKINPIKNLIIKLTISLLFALSLVEYIKSVKLWMIPSEIAIVKSIKL